MIPAPTNAQTEVTLRPYLSSAYIMKRLAHGTAKFIASVYCSDFVMVKPFDAMMFGSQAPSPMATPKNAVKQIMPAMTRPGNWREHHAERVALGVAGRVGCQRLRRPGNAETTENVDSLLAAPVRREITRRFRQREAQHPDHQRADAAISQTPRQT